MAKITYENKVALNDNANVDPINKVRDIDMNEIKQVVNQNDDNMGDLSSLETTIKTSIVNAINEVLSSIPVISNIYGTSQTDGYSQEYLNGYILYEDTTGEGTISDITLTDSLSNYEYIEIVCKRAATEGNASGYSIHKFPANAPSITLDLSYLGANNLVEYTTVYSMSGTSITILYNVIKQIVLANNTSSLSLTNGVRITKIIGYSKKS